MNLNVPSGATTPPTANGAVEMRAIGWRGTVGRSFDMNEAPLSVPASQGMHLDHALLDPRAVLVQREARHAGEPVRARRHHCHHRHQRELAADLELELDRLRGREAGADEQILRRACGDRGADLVVERTGPAGLGHQPDALGGQRAVAPERDARIVGRADWWREVRVVRRILRVRCRRPGRVEHDSIPGRRGTLGLWHWRRRRRRRGRCRHRRRGGRRHGSATFTAAGGRESHQHQQGQCASCHGGETPEGGAIFPELALTGERRWS